MRFSLSKIKKCLCDYVIWASSKTSDIWGTYFPIRDNVFDSETSWFQNKFMWEIIPLRTNVSLTQSVQRIPNTCIPKNIPTFIQIVTRVSTRHVHVDGEPHVPNINMTVCCLFFDMTFSTYWHICQYTRGPFTLHRLALIPVWMIKHMFSKGGEITYPFPNFNSFTAEIWE